MTTAKISVVIPTYNRSDLLRSTLNALAAQTLSHDEFEVVVVDDGGRDDSAKVVEEFSKNLNTKYFWQEDRGFRAGKARNVGTAIADGKYIVYVDTGVLLGQDTLKRHLDLHSTSVKPTVFLGYVYGFEVSNDLTNEISKWVTDDDVNATIKRLESLKAFDIRNVQYDELGSDLKLWPAPFDVMWTCHMSAERESLLNAGLFDESFNTWGGEDVDLGVRLFLKNNVFELDKSLQSFHWPHPKEVLDIKIQSATAAQRIHNKYRLWETSFYGMNDLEDKYSLNKVILESKRNKFNSI